MTTTSGVRRLALALVMSGLATLGASAPAQALSDPTAPAKALVNCNAEAVTYLKNTKDVAGFESRESWCVLNFVNAVYGMAAPAEVEAYFHCVHDGTGNDPIKIARNVVPCIPYLQ